MAGADGLAGDDFFENAATPPTQQDNEQQPNPLFDGDTPIVLNDDDVDTGPDLNGPDEDSDESAADPVDDGESDSDDDGEDGDPDIDSGDTGGPAGEALNEEAAESDVGADTGDVPGHDDEPLGGLDVDDDDTEISDPAPEGLNEDDQPGVNEEGPAEDVEAAGNDLTLGESDAESLAMAGIGLFSEGADATPSIDKAPKAIFVIEHSTLNDGETDHIYTFGGDWGVSVDGDPNQQITLEVFIDDTEHGSLVAGLPGGTAITGGLAFTGSVSDAQAWLAQLTFVAAIDKELGTATAKLSLTVMATAGTNVAEKTAQVSITPSNDPVTIEDATVVVDEGTTHIIGADVLNAVDPEVKVGTQSADQIIYRLEKEPEHGYLTLTVEGETVRLGEGSIFTHDDVNEGRLQYVHTATGANQNANDGFEVSVNDGATPQDKSAKATVTIEIDPVNQAPTVSGRGVIYEGQPANAVDSSGNPEVRH